MTEFMQVKNISFDYPGFEEEKPLRALDSLSFSVQAGEFIAIVGRNGSGKSTLAKQLNALLVPTEGDVTVNGWNTKDETHTSDIRRTAGMVFQNPDNQLVSSIVEDDIAFGPENLGIDPEEIGRRVDKALAAVRMGSFRGKAPHRLSGGQKQRIAIAGVLAMRPACIIFDEPTAMLDPQGRRDVMETMLELHQEGIAIILVTHFMEEAVLADRVLLMQAGKLLLDGTPEEVFAQTETVLDAGLELPAGIRMANALRRNGIAVPPHVLQLKKLYAPILAQAKGGSPESAPVSVRDTEQGAVTAPHPEGSNGIVVQDICYTYSKGLPGETRALDSVSMTVAPGRIAALIGHTGSGKSTLLQHLNGLLKPDSGRIFISGQEITAPDTSLLVVRRKVGLVFQYPEYQLFEETVAKDVAFGPKNLGLDREEIESRVREAIALVGLQYEDVAERSPFELSGGQKRRVAIAGVIAMKPDVLILDEPTAGLDPAAHRDIMKMIRTVHEKSGNITLLVSHSMEDVAALADRVFVMDGGKIALSGSPREVFRDRDFLHGIQLSLPPVAELLCDLKEAGLPVDTGIFEEEAASVEIGRILRTGFVTGGTAGDADAEPEPVATAKRKA